MITFSRTPPTEYPIVTASGKHAEWNLRHMRGAKSPALFSIHVSELVGIRGILSVLIVCGHVNDYLIPWFWGSMEIFFVLSGYLVADIIIAWSRQSEYFRAAYYIRRACRIAPVYLAVLASTSLFTYALSVYHGDRLELWRGLVSCLFFIQNVEFLSTALSIQPITIDYPIGFLHSWSVALEEQFYFLAALVLPYLTRGKAARVGYLVLLLSMSFLLSLGLRVLGTDWVTLPARTDGFACGVGLALYLHYRDYFPNSSSWGDTLAAKRIDGIVRLMLIGAGTGSIAIVLLSYLLRTANPSPIWGIGSTAATALVSMSVSFFAITGAGAIGYCIKNSGSADLAWLRSASLSYFGRISYSTYLWHIPFLYAIPPGLTKFYEVPSIMANIVAGLMAFGVAHFSFRFIEKPFVTIGKRFRPKQY